MKNLIFVFFFHATMSRRGGGGGGGATSDTLTMLKFSSKQLRTVPTDDIRREYDAQLALSRQLPAGTADTGARFMLSLHVIISENSGISAKFHFNVETLQRPIC